MSMVNVDATTTNRTADNQAFVQKSQTWLARNAMYQNYLLVVMLLGCMATQSNAQLDAKSERIDWLALTHDSNLSKKKLLADTRVAIQEKIPFSDLKEGTVYLYCMESGALLDAVPIKDAYRVMIFPDPKATKFNFRVVDGEFLLKEGIDVKLLRQVLRMNKEPGMGGPSTPFTLDVRFTAKWNLPREAINTTKP